MGMTYFDTTNKSIKGAGGLTYGMDFRGMENYLDAIKLNVKNIQKKIADVSGIQKQIDLCWQGVSRDAFLSNLDNEIENLNEIIEQEYYDLVARLQELVNNMYSQDKTMYKGYNY